MYVGPLRRGYNEALAPERRRVTLMAFLAGAVGGVAQVIAGLSLRVAGWASQRLGGVFAYRHGGNAFVKKNTFG